MCNFTHNDEITRIITINQSGSVGILETEIYTNELYQNFPNPFNPITKIKFSLASKQNTKVTILNTKGEVLKTLINKDLEKGLYFLNFDGSTFTSGQYYYKIKTDAFTKIHRMVLTK